MTGYSQRLQKLPPGCYSLPPLLGAHILILHQLPKTPHTLWLRLLGKGRCQREAIQEVLALPTANNYRNLALQLLANWKIALDTFTPPPSEEEETLMALTQAYLEWEAKTLSQGEQRGLETGQRQMLLEMLGWELEFKFGERGVALKTALEAVQTVADLYALARSIKPLQDWEALRDWWLNYWEQGIEDDRDRWLQGLDLALQLRFPAASVAAMAEAKQTLQSIATTEGLGAAIDRWRNTNLDIATRQDP